MRRIPVLDPPEYVNWQADPELVREYGERLGKDPERRDVVARLDDSMLLAMYAGMLRQRLSDQALKRWVRQGIISKAWLGTGEEAATIGAVFAVERGVDVVVPMIRNAGAYYEFDLPIAEVFRRYLGTGDSGSHGRHMHAGAPELGVIQAIATMGDMVPVVTGMALAFRRRHEPRVALTWVGDGATKTGPFHEGLNLAAVMKVPAVFILQNNQVALGTRVDQHQAGDFSAWPRAYGVAGAFADGNNVLDVYAATRLAVDRARRGDGPTLLIVETFRMGGHATHDEAEARRVFAADLFERWGRRDPIGLFEAYLTARGIQAERLGQVEQEVAAEVEAAAEEALRSRENSPTHGEAAELSGVSAGRRQPGLAHRLATSS